MKTRDYIALWALAAFALGASCASDHVPTGALLPNERPIIGLSTAPQPGDSVSYPVRFTWFSYDSDGEVVKFRYAVDPPVEGETTWVETVDHVLELKFRSKTPSGTAPTGIVGTDYHVFAIEAVDDRGLTSLPKSEA